MNLDITYLPEVENADLWVSRVVGVSSPVIIEYTTQGLNYTATGTRYTDGALVLEVDAATRNALGLNDLLRLTFGSTEVTVKVETIEEDGAAPGTYLIETNYTAGDTPALAFVLISPADFIIETIVKANDKAPFSIVSRIDANGVSQVDISPALLQYLRVNDSFNYSDASYREPLNSIEFTLSYQSVSNGSPSQAINIEGNWMAVLSTNQNLNVNDSNLIEYVPTGALPLAKYLNTYEGKAPAWAGYPFWLDAIFDNAILNPSITVGVDTVNIDISNGRGVYRINGKQDWITGQHGEVCSETTGTGDGVEPPPVSQTKILTSYHFRGVAPVEEGTIDPPPTLDPSTCGAVYLTDSKKLIGGYVPINTVHQTFELPDGEIIIYGLDATRGENGLLPCWQFIAEYDNGDWTKLATSANYADIAGPFTGDLSVFDSSTFPTCDGYLDYTGFPPIGNRLDDLNTVLTAMALPNIPAGQYASVKQWLWYRNTSGATKQVALWQIVPPLSKKYFKLSAFARRICP